MITNIIYGSDIPKTSIDRIKELIEQEKGILRFRFHAVEDWHLEQGDLLSPDSLFENGRRFRKSKRIPDNEFVITVTDLPNAQNYYASLAETDPFTGFVHSGEWDKYIACERELPVAFTIVNLLTAFFTCPSYDRVLEFLHQRPIGCANDFCGHKREVIFKLRTGDVCMDCIRSMQRNGWSDLLIDHSMRILTKLSEDMRFNRYFQPVMDPSPIRIDMDKGGRVTLPKYEDIELRIQPIDLTFYLFFLKYSREDGLRQTVFNEEWALKAIDMIYFRLRPVRKVETNEKRKKETELTARYFAKKEPREQSKSRINRIINEALGSRLAKPYIIDGKPKNPFKVALPSGNVEVLNFNLWNNLPTRP